jgi:hypothetical protein
MAAFQSFSSFLPPRDGFMKLHFGVFDRKSFGAIIILELWTTFWNLMPLKSHTIT